MTFQKANELAIKRSKENKDQRYYVILIDSENDEYVNKHYQTYSVCKENYLNAGEFEAFEGKVIDEYFNGELVW